MIRKVTVLMFVFVGVLCFYIEGYAQNEQGTTKKILGKVIDGETGEPIIGANVYLEGTTRGASTNLEGEFVITGVQPGTYTVIVSALSYRKKHISQFTVTNAAVHTLNVQLFPEALQGREVVVEGTALLSYEGVLLKQRKNAAAVSDAMSAEQIKKAPDATSSDALRRLTGISIVDNKFVFVRGVTDRYSQTMLNGATLASLETDRRSFSFDMLPTNLLENIVVVKSATPEMRGDFTGGLVQLNTLDFPEKQLFTLTAGTAYNTSTTFRSINRTPQSSLDWLGMDDGMRKFPENESDLLKVARQLPNNWAPEKKRALLNTSFSLTYGDLYAVDDELQIGVVGALTYRNSYQRNNRTISDVTLGRYSEGTRDDYSVLWGGLANVSVRLTSSHKISFKNTYNQSGEDQVGIYRSEDLNTNLENRFTASSWSQRSIYSGQLLGEHHFSFLGGTVLDWKLYTSLSTKEVPDRKEVTYYREYGTDNPFEVAVNKRSWSKLNDKNSGVAIDMASPLGSGKLKIGSMLEQRTSKYAIRYFDVIPDYYGGIPSWMVQAPLEVVYAPENFGRGKFLFSEISKPSDRYTGKQQLIAGYVMTDMLFFVGEEKFRFVGGVRLEHNEQQVEIPRSLVTAETDKAALKGTDVLPSLNLTYAFSDQMNIRIAYAKTVNRPEFREMARTGFYDFIRNEIVGGNPDIQQSVAHNYDIRLEVFPAAVELFAVSAFYKQIVNAIEEQLMYTATRSRTWFNSPRAVNAGWEIEVRKELGFLSSFFNQSSFTLNYTRVFSNVDFTVVEGNSQSTRQIKAKRPMQGQSPYVVNGALLFVVPTLGTTLNVFYNKFGRRLDAVGFLAADVYEEPREVIDVSVTQPLFGTLELKFSVRNLNGSKKVYSRAGLLYERSDVGRTYSLQLSQTL